MELLILKSGDQYIRFKEGQYLLCGLDKAGVFPLDQVETVKKHLHCLQAGPFEAVTVKKLILTEEDFTL